MRRGILIIGSTIQQSPILGFSHAAPLLEEERHALLAALIADGDDPLPLHRTRAGAALAADDDPTDSGKINLAEIFEQRLDGQEPNLGRRLPQMVNARQAVSSIFDADSPPDVF